MSAFPQPPFRDFDDITRDLERVIRELKQSTLPEDRVILLREIRVLLTEADQVFSDEP
jgi:hypothetical protein